MMARSKILQSEAGYIDARPLTTRSTNLLQRTAGPYMGSQPAVEDPEAHVRSAPDQRTSAAFPASSPWGQERPRCQVSRGRSATLKASREHDLKDEAAD
jgi:hypothetical protein